MNRLFFIIAFMFLFIPNHTFAQDFCKGDFNYDGNVDSEDVTTFLEHFGRNQYFNPCPSDGPTPVPKTGQTRCWDEFGVEIPCVGTGQDGDLERGVALVTPRFTDNEDGTVTDNQTGLIWLQEADCVGVRISWNQALSYCNGLSDGSCGLTDGSNAGDWRLPNRMELLSLINSAYYMPALSDSAGTGPWSEGDPFLNVQNYGYWSSTNYEERYAFVVGIQNGASEAYSKTSSTWYVWPVRGGR